MLRVSAWANQQYGKKIGLRDLVAEFRSEDLDPELRAVLSAIASGDKVASVRAGEVGRPWPAVGSSAAREAAKVGVTEVLDLFEAAGIFD